jgi:hypothetical protein
VPVLWCFYCYGSVVQVEVRYCDTSSIALFGQYCLDYLQSFVFENSFSNIAGYKINLQKSVVFLNTNNEQIEKEYRKTIPFILASKIIKYLGVNLKKDINDLFKKNYKPLKKEIEEDY